MAAIQQVENGNILNNKPSNDAAGPAGGELGYDQFLKLLCAEMQYQDPLEPTSNTEYVAQLATFSQMEAMLNMQNTIASSNANALVGKYVEIHSTSETTGETFVTEGFVDLVQYMDGKQFLSVNGKLYPVSDVYKVADQVYIEAITLAQSFMDAVAKLPDADKLTLKDREEVEKLIKVYTEMSAYQKAYVSQEVHDRFGKIAGTMKGMAFHDDLSKLPEVDKLTLNDKKAIEKIEELRKTYDSLSSFEKGFINEKDYKKLQEYEKKVEELGGGNAGGSEGSGNTDSGADGDGGKTV